MFLKQHIQDLFIQSVCVCVGQETESVGQETDHSAPMEHAHVWSPAPISTG